MVQTPGGGGAGTLAPGSHVAAPQSTVFTRLVNGAGLRSSIAIPVYAVPTDGNRIASTNQHSIKTGRK